MTEFHQTPMTPSVVRVFRQTPLLCAMVANRLLSSAMRSNDDSAWPVHSLMLSFHDFRAGFPYDEQHLPLLPVARVSTSCIMLADMAAPRLNYMLPNLCKTTRREMNSKPSIVTRSLKLPGSMVCGIDVAVGSTCRHRRKFEFGWIT